MGNYFENNDKTLCCGCRGCELICPTSAISMIEDNEGFMYPFVDEDKCIHCGMCVKVCPIKDGGYTNDLVSSEPVIYGAYNKEKTVLEESTSGGAFTGIIDSFFEDHILVCGAIFDDDFFVKHLLTDDINLFSKFRGSKYVQSDLNNSYSEIRKSLRKGSKVLFSGTPCQVAGLKAFLGKEYDNLLCVDIVCHGVPSPKIFSMYKEYLQDKYKSKLANINFRDKSIKGWDTPYMTIEFENGNKLKSIGYDDPYSMGFYKKLFQRPVCHSCPFSKVPRVSDITLADYWGVENTNPEFKNNRGTSLMLMNTKKAQMLYDKLCKNLVLGNAILADAIKYNPQLAKATDPNPKRPEFMVDVKSGYNFKKLEKKYFKRRSFLKRFLSIILNKETKIMIKKIFKV
ncbi:MAG: Coenzyme F420 hydrogenase/dehydrogenase, beta subunit C-terminal domain [Firmicutes bacterium]|nr:Coenzyme F420 hydrogenase/dehydrogenase, beta subunit C-terminal domain [Bacillota bacterium]